jgi:hypothetical protein
MALLADFLSLISLARPTTGINKIAPFPAASRGRLLNSDARRGTLPRGQVTGSTDFAPVALKSYGRGPCRMGNNEVDRQGSRNYIFEDDRPGF